MVLANFPLASRDPSSCAMLAQNIGRSTFAVTLSRSMGCEISSTLTAIPNDGVSAEHGRCCRCSHCGPTFDEEFARIHRTIQACFPIILFRWLLSSMFAVVVILPGKRISVELERAPHRPRTSYVRRNRSMSRRVRNCGHRTRMPGPTGALEFV